jgi:hypothetical protein
VAGSASSCFLEAGERRSPPPQPHFIALARHLRRTFTHQEHRMFSTLIVDLTPSWPSQIDVTIDIHVRR